MRKPHCRSAEDKQAGPDAKHSSHHVSIALSPGLYRFPTAHGFFPQNLRATALDWLLSVRFGTRTTASFGTYHSQSAHSYGRCTSEPAGRYSRADEADC